MTLMMNSAGTLKLMCSQFVIILLIKAFQNSAQLLNYCIFVFIG